jgi:hypothetical protein
MEIVADKGGGILKTWVGYSPGQDFINFFFFALILNHSKLYLIKLTQEKHVLSIKLATLFFN